PTAGRRPRGVRELPGGTKLSRNQRAPSDRMDAGASRAALANLAGNREWVRFHSRRRRTARTRDQRGWSQSARGAGRASDLWFRHLQRRARRSAEYEGDLRRLRRSYSLSICPGAPGKSGGGIKDRITSVVATRRADAGGSEHAVSRTRDFWRLLSFFPTC